MYIWLCNYAHTHDPGWVITHIPRPLLPPHTDPQSGRVLLDGVDLRALSLQWLRQQMGLVAQVREREAYC
jgi:hypothetical protein